MTFGERTRELEQPPVRGYVLARDEGKQINLPGWSMLVKVSASDTAARLTVVEGLMQAGNLGPAAHVHDGHDETFVLIHGRLRFRIGDAFHTAVPGQTVFAGRHLAHGFSNPFDEPARYLVLLTPSGYEDYFGKLADHISRTGATPAPEEVADLMAQHGTVLAPTLHDPGT